MAADTHPLSAELRKLADETSTPYSSKDRLRRSADALDQAHQRIAALEGVVEAVTNYAYHGVSFAPVYTALEALAPQKDASDASKV